MRNKRVAVIGTVGGPANYGGFETLVRYHGKKVLLDDVIVHGFTFQAQ